MRYLPLTPDDRRDMRQGVGERAGLGVRQLGEQLTEPVAEQ